MFSRIRQDGGGKMKKKEKEIYLGHCDVILNTEKQPLTVEQIIESAKYLFYSLKHTAIEETYKKHEDTNREKLIEDIRIIFDSATAKYDKIIKTIIDPTFLRIELQTFINIVSFQVLVAFTYYLLGYREPTIDDFWNPNKYESVMCMEFIGSTPYNELQNHSTEDWRIYRDEMKETMIISVLTKEDYANGLIITLTHFGVDDTIQFLLKNKCMCGMLFEHEYTDGRKILPVEFVIHDITHYTNFRSIFASCKPNNIVDVNQLYEYVKDFYEHIKKLDNIYIQYPTKLILYLTFHEPVSRIQCYTNVHNKYTEYKNTYTHFLSDINNLGLLIPKKIRILEDGSETKLRKNIIEAYLDYAVACYKYAFDTFKDPKKTYPVPKIPDMLKPYLTQTAGRRKSHRKRNTKRRKQPRSRRRRHRK